MAGRGGGIFGLQPCVVYYDSLVDRLLHFISPLEMFHKSARWVAGGIDGLSLSTLMLMINGIGSSNHYIQ